MPIHAKLTKLSSKAGMPSALDDGYYVRGHYAELPTIGRCFIIERYERNGISISGVLTTSPVTKVAARGFETLNSRYRLKNLSDSS